MNQPPPDYRDMQYAPAQAGEEVFNLRTSVAVLLDHWPVAVSILAAGIAMGVYKSWIAIPVYESAAIIEVEGQTSGFAVGPQTQSDSSLMYMPQAVAAQMEILRSRRVLGAAAELLDLTLDVRPVHWGKIGATLARNYRGTEPARPPLFMPGSTKYAWGGEKIKISAFKIPDSMVGRNYYLVATGDGSYVLHNAKDIGLGAGNVGTELQINAGTDQEIRLNVARLEARPGTRFQLRRLSLKDAADSLARQMRVSERGGRNSYMSSGILAISVRAPTPEEAADQANAIARTYLRMNVERLSEGAEKKLEFLNSQLPRLQIELATAEQALLEQRTQNGAFQLSDGAKSILDSMAGIEREVGSLELQRAEMSQTLTAQHPAMAALDRKLDQLRSERARVNRQISTLPDAEARQLQLMRDSKVSGELYISLLNAAQELKVAKAGTIGNVHIVDDAMPEPGAVEPKIERILISWAALGLIAGLAAVFLRKHLNVKLEWAEDAEKKIGLPVYATIPFSSQELELNKQANGSKSRRLLAEFDPQDIAIESLRSLRASLHFSMMEAKRNLVVITGSTPSVGKSFVTANLAKLVADSGKRVLLIDADMRKGRMHKMLGFDRGPGLSELIAGQVTAADVVKKVEDGGDKFFAITTGKLPPNPAELLGSERFVELVEAFCKDYDLVLVDTPPVLNLADGILVARSAGAVFVTIRGGQSSVPDVQDCIQRFSKNGVKVNGLIFNGMRFSLGSYVHPTYYHYRYRYTRYGGKPSKS